MTDQPPPMPEMPALGPEGEVCSACQAPLAIDQRYCLECGRRRGSSRVEFAELLPLPAGAASGQPGRTVTETTSVEQGGVPAAMGAQSPWTPFAMVASIAVLALMLLVGVMIGRDDDPTQVTAATPVAPVATTPTETAAGTSAGTAGGAAGGSGGSGGGGGGASTGGGGDGGGGGGVAVEEPPPAESAPGAEVIDQAQLEELDSLSGEEQQEASKNLPDTIAIPGEPPPVDDVAPGDGTKAETIG